tara:strand:+ start:1180 stop:1578 length:399 start_codon:yes stop_codon:yes gene_type:complete
MNEGYIKKSKSNNWGTPKNIIEKYKDYFDPCPYNYKVDGLKIEWKDKNFVNPPFDKLNLWCKKINEEVKKGKEVVLLIPARTDTKYFHKYILPLDPKIEFIKGRLKYIDLDNSSKKPTSAPFPTLLITINKK